MEQASASPHRLSALASVPATRAVLEQFGLGTKTALGQHFLISDGVVKHICALAQVNASDIVLEIGPGIGTLTLGLLACGARVVAIERDADLIPVLATTCADHADALQVVNADALGVSSSDLPARPTKLVANLPYAVAATLVLDSFQQRSSIESATVMVQTEVAQRMAAAPSTKDYGAFTVKLGLYAAEQESFRVPPGNFFPPPRVDSTVIRLNRIDRGLDEQVVRAACVMADAAFATRRKTILNSCRTHFASLGIDVDAADVLAQAGIDARRRGETLAIEEYVELGFVALKAGVLDRLPATS